MFQRLEPARGPVRLLSALLLALSIAGCGFAPLGQSAAPARLSAFSEKSDYQLFIEPDDGQAPVLKAIQDAEKTLDVSMYILSSPEVIAGLTDAQARGVAVRVLMEPAPFNPSNPNIPLPINRKTFDALKAAGVQVRYIQPRFKYLHQKTIVVDGRAAIVMTSNLSRAAFESNREYGLIDRSASDVSEIQAMFEADWDNREFTPQDPDLVVSPSNSRSHLRSFIAKAKRSIFIQMEVLGDPELSKALGARVKEGVDVRVQLARFDSGGTNQSELQELQAAGVQKVRFLKKPVLHAKLMVVDGEAAYLGSVNLTTNSMDNNRELGVIVTDSPLVKRLAKIADRDWAASD
ncbi:MAG TPA: phospholipase D-like domain-containing protein [Stenomitos sp.]